MERTTFWKVEEIPPKLEVRVMALGRAEEVSSRILSIPKATPYFSAHILDGYVSVLWNVDRGVVVDFRPEPEFGEEAVFSIILERRMVSPRDFFRFYVQLSELLGVIMLEDGTFVTPSEFRSRL